MSKKYKDFLEKNFNVLKFIGFPDTNQPTKVLKIINSFKSDHPYLYQNKIVLEHFDTDYYKNKILKHGVFIYNFIEIIKSSGMPLSTFILVTNHFGIGKEIDELLFDWHKEDRPIIIETFIQSTIETKKLENIPLRIEEIEFPALCMLGTSRSHRVALYNWLNDNNLLKNIEITVRKTDE